MSSLTVLRQIVSSLSKEEKDVAANFLKLFNTRGEAVETKYLKLFELLCNEDGEKDKLTDKQIEQYIYGGSSSAFPKLVLRLKAKIVESLTLSINLERKGAYTDRGRTVHYIRKQLSAAQILSFRGLSKLSTDILDECITYAGKYEFYEEWLTALRINVQTTALQNKTAVSQALSDEFDRVQKMYIGYKLAQKYYSDLINHIEYHSNPIDTALLRYRANELKKIALETKSANIAYFQTFLEIQLNQEEEKYISASEILTKQYKLIEKHPALNSPERLSLALVNLGWNEILTHRFKNTLKFSNKVDDLLPFNHTNRNQNELNRFYAYYYLGEYSKAQKVLTILDNRDDEKGSEFRQGKRQYFRACVLFLEGEHKQVNEILRTLNPIEKDTDGWNIWFRILHIINDIELELTENAFNRIQSLRKQMLKLQPQSRDSARLIAIYEVLKLLANSRFEFVQVKKRKQAEVENLSLSEHLKWRTTSPELIIFDQWFESHYYRTKFKQTIPDYWEPAQ
nr:hypothetical protein [Bacteroidia bacterium]